MRNSQPQSPVSSISGRLRVPDPRDPVTQLFESLRPDLLRFAQWLARDRAIAEDIVQEALLRAWRSRDALKDQAAARPWLLTIVRREHARLYERKRLELVSLDDAVEIAPSPGAGESEDQLFALRHAIMKLPIQYREPLVLQVLGGFTTEEIAHELALSSTAVLTRLFRARNKLRTLCGMTPVSDVVGERGAGMTCDEARLLIGGDPAASTPELEEHVRGCAACAQLRREMQALDGDILRALQQPPDMIARHAGAAGAPRGVSGRWRPARYWRLSPCSHCGSCGRVTRWRTMSCNTCRGSLTAGLPRSRSALMNSTTL